MNNRAGICFWTRKFADDACAGVRGGNQFSMPWRGLPEGHSVYKRIEGNAMSGAELTEERRLEEKADWRKG